MFVQARSADYHRRRHRCAPVGARRLLRVPVPFCLVMSAAHKVVVQPSVFDDDLVRRTSHDFMNNIFEDFFA